MTTKGERDWFARKAKELVDTQASVMGRPDRHHAGRHGVLRGG